MVLSALIVIVATAVGLVLAGCYSVAMPGRSHRGPLPPLNGAQRAIATRLAGHVHGLAGTIGERHIWRTETLDRAARYVEDQWSQVGYRVSAQDYETRGVAVCNLEAELRGRDRADEIIVVGAHYDSVFACPGANDNATGVAALLELARHFSGEQLARTVRFVAFVNEEPPFSFTAAMGSRVYARRCRRRDENVVAMLALETIGYYTDAPGSQRYPFPFGLAYPRTGNFIGFVGNLSSRALVRRCVGTFRRGVTFPAEGTAAPGYLPGVFWSDHWSFWRERYRALMVTDTALFRYRHYHTAADTADKVDCERMARVVEGLTTVIADLARG